MSYKFEASSRVTLRIFKLFSPGKITHKNQDENQTASITGFLGARYKVNLHRVESKSTVVALHS